MCCPRVSLHINSSKTEYMAYNLRRQGDLTTLDCAKLRQVDDFQYLGSWKDQTTKDLEIRKAKAWAASNKLTVVWKSSISTDLRIRFFRASVKSVLLYWSENLTLTTALEKHLDGCHTKLLRAALKVSCNDHISNKELYRDLPPISTRLSLKVRRLQFNGHCWRSKNGTVSHFFWEPNTADA